MSNQNIIQEFIAHPDQFLYDEQIVIAFVRLYQTQPELFSDFQNSLAKLCNNLPDNLDAISGKILEWCQYDAPKVYRELLSLLPGPEDTRGPGGRKNMNVEKAKELIYNGIRKSIPDKPINDQHKPSDLKHHPISRF